MAMIRDYSLLSGHLIHSIDIDNFGFEGNDMLGELSTGKAYSANSTTRDPSSAESGSEGLAQPWETEWTNQFLVHGEQGSSEFDICPNLCKHPWLDQPSPADSGGTGGAMAGNGSRSSEDDNETFNDGPDDDHVTIEVHGHDIDVGINVVKNARNIDRSAIDKRVSEFLRRPHSTRFYVEVEYPGGRKGWRYPDERIPIPDIRIIRVKVDPADQPPEPAQPVQFKQDRSPPVPVEDDQQQGDSSPRPPLQDPAVVEEYYKWCRSQPLSTEGLADLQQPPFDMIGWRDPSEADRQPTKRKWLFFGKLRYKRENGHWKRNLHTEAPPRYLMKSKWLNRNRNKTEMRRVGDQGSVMVRTEKRYFKWVAGNTPEGLEVERKWSKWTFILHEEVPAEVVERQKFKVEDMPESGPEFYGLFTLKLMEAKKGKTGRSEDDQVSIPSHGKKRKSSSDDSRWGRGSSPSNSEPGSIFYPLQNHTAGGWYMHHAAGMERTEEWERDDVPLSDSDVEEDESCSSEGDEPEVQDVASISRSIEEAVGRLSLSGGISPEGQDVASISLPLQKVVGRLSLSGPTDLQVFTMENMRAATKDFEVLLEDGNEAAFLVYRGELPTGQMVMVKRVKLPCGSKVFEEVRNQQARVHHQHLANLIGYSNENGEEFLVYSWPIGDTLFSRLYGQAGDTALRLSERLSLARDLASGLEYLHTKCNPEITHGRISARSVIVEPAGSARLINWMVAGLSESVGSGYENSDEYLVAGEYYGAEFFGGTPDHESDVCAFGVLLLEMISSRRPYDSKRPPKEARLIEWAYACVSKNEIEKLVDPAIQPLTPREVTEAQRLGRLALRCVGRDRSRRPSAGGLRAYIQAIIDGTSRGSPSGSTDGIALAGAAAGTVAKIEETAPVEGPQSQLENIPRGMLEGQHSLFEALTRRMD